MDARDDGKEPRRVAHRGEQRRILDPFTEIQQRHSKLLVGVPLDERSARSASPIARSLKKRGCCDAGPAVGTPPSESEGCYRESVIQPASKLTIAGWGCFLQSNQYT